MSIISRELEAISQQLHVTASILIQNRPDTSDMNEITKIQAYGDYLDHFFRTNDSIEAALHHVSEISLVEPLNSSKIFLESLPKIQISPKFVPEEKNSFIARIDKTLLKNEDVQYCLKVMTEVIAAIYIKLVASRLIKQMESIKQMEKTLEAEKTNEIKTNKQIEEIMQFESVKKMYSNISMSVVSHKLLTYIMTHALRYKTEKDLLMISLPTAGYWADALFYVSQNSSRESFSMMMTILRNFESSSSALNLILMKVFTGLPIKEITSDQVKEFADLMKPIGKIMMKNVSATMYCNIFCNFVYSFVNEVITHCPDVNVSDLLSPISKFISNNLSHPERGISAPELEALNLVFSNKKEKAIKDFIEKKLIPLLNYEYRNADFLKSLTIILRGRNENNQKPFDKETLKVIYSAFERATAKRRYFTTAQTELSEFLVQLALADVEVFQKEKLAFISSDNFTTNNHLAFTDAITTLLLQDTENSSKIKDKIGYKNHLTMTADSVIDRFLKNSQISLAPMNSTIFRVQSLVSAIKATSLEFQQLPNISHPIQPDNLTPRLIAVKWKKIGSRTIPNAITKIYKPKVNLTLGYLGAKEEYRVNGPIGVLNMSTFTKATPNKIKKIASLVLSSTDSIAAMTIHVLQASIHIENTICKSVIAAVRDLVFLCPTIEHAHLFRIIYTVEQIVESIIYLNINAEPNIIIPIVQVAVLGLCSSSSIVRKAALRLITIAGPIIGVDVFAAFESDVEASSNYPSTTAQNSVLIDFISTDKFGFTEVALSGLNNLYQFFLASYARYFKKYDTDVIQFLLDCVGFFEKGCCDIYFLQNIYVFIANCIKQSNVNNFNLEDIWVDIVGMNGIDNAFFLPALFSAIDECTVKVFLRPVATFIQPSSFRLSQLIKNSSINTRVLIPFISQLFILVFDQSTDFVPNEEVSESTQRLDTEDDSATYYQLMSAQAIFSRMYKEKVECSHSPFPRQKDVLPIEDKELRESEWNSWYHVLFKLFNSASSVVKKMATECFREALSVFKPSNQLIKTMLHNRRVIRSSLLPPLFSWAFEINADDFLERSDSEEDYFFAFADQFSYFGQPKEFIKDWKFAVNGSQDNFFSRFIYEHAGDLIAISYFYLLTSFVKSNKVKALNILSVVSLTIILWKNGPEECSKAYKLFFSIKRYLERSLSVVLAMELQKTSEFLLEEIPFIGEQFINRMLKISTNEIVAPFMSTFISLVIPWINSQVRIELFARQLDTKKQVNVCKAAYDVFRCMSPHDFFKRVFEIPQNAVFNKVVKAFIRKTDFSIKMFILYAAHLYSDNKTSAAVKDKTLAVANFLLNTYPYETLDLYSMMMSVEFFHGLSNRKYYEKLVEYINKNLLHLWNSSTGNSFNISKQKFANIFSAMDVHLFDSAPLIEKFPEYFDIEEYTNALIRWSRCGDGTISSNAMLTIGKHEECIARIDLDSAMSNCFKAAYELSLIDEVTFEKDEVRIKYIERHLLVIEASLIMISKCPIEVRIKYFWTAVSFLRSNIKFAENVTIAALNIIRNILHLDRSEGIDKVMEEKPEDFEGLANIFLNGVHTKKTIEVWKLTIEESPLELLTNDEDSPIIDFINNEAFPINLRLNREPVSIKENIQRMSKTEKQAVVDFTSAFSRVLSNPEERIPFLQLTADVVNCCFESNDGINFKSMTNLANVIKGDIVSNLTNAHISLIRAFSRAKVKNNVLLRENNANELRGRFPFIYINGKTGSKEDSINYLKVDSSMEVEDELLMIQWREAVKMPWKKETKELDQSEVEIPVISVESIEELSELI